jgi:hypothetical protein
MAVPFCVEGVPMSCQDRWCKSANDIVIDAWRYARHLDRTTAERFAVFNVEMERLERRGADGIRSHAKNAGDFDQSHDCGPAAENPQARLRAENLPLSTIAMASLVVSTE